MDATAKRAAEGEDRADPEYLGEASLSHLTRKTTEARSKATKEWIRDHVRRERRYRPPPRGKLHRRLSKVRKESPRALSVRLLFRDERATPALLEFLADTRVG